jgi:DNA mismatch repair protein MSH6
MRNKGTLPTSKYAKPPPQQKGSGKEIVRRELRSVVTSGTIVDGNILTDDAATCLLAIKVSLFIACDSCACHKAKENQEL